MDKAQQSISNPFSSLAYPNFRYYWIGMCISLIGTWMQNIALPWVAYTLTNSPLLLSLVGVAQFTPVLFLSLFAGALLDRFPKKTVLIVTQVVFLLLTLMMTLLVFSGTLKYWHILVLSILMGIVNSFDMPARQSLVVHLVDKEFMMNAIALNSMAFNMARVIGPTIAGIIMINFGVAVCFLINTISYGAVIIGLLLVKTNEVIENKAVKGLNAIRRDINSGLHYILEKREILWYLIVIFIVGVFSLNNNVLLPVLIKEDLGLDETYFGLIMSIFGIGSFFGALASAMMSKRGPQKHQIFLYPIIMGITLILTSLWQNFALIGITLAFTGFFFIVFAAAVNTAIQTDLSPKFRGRVLSVYTLVFAGAIPFGNFFAGFITDQFGARIAFAACGFSIIAFMSLVLHKKKSLG